MVRGETGGIAHAVNKIDLTSDSKRIVHAPRDPAGEDDY